MNKNLKVLCRRGVALFLASVMVISMSIATSAEMPEEGDAVEDMPVADEETFAGDDIDINTIVVPQAEDSENVSTDNSEGIDESENTDESQNTDEPEFDLTQIERPGETEGVISTPGTPEELEWMDDSEKTENGDAADPVAAEGADESEFDPATAERPEQTEGVTSTPDAPGDVDGDNSGEQENENSDGTIDSGNVNDQPSINVPNENWDIFYDADRDVYKVTFKISEDVDDPEVVIDLTKALEWLGKYAATAEKPKEPVKDFTEPGLSAEDQAKWDAYVEEQRAWDEEDYPYICKMVAKMNDDAWVENHTMEKIVEEFNTNPYRGFYGIPAGMKASIPVKPDIPEIDKNSPEYQEYLDKQEAYDAEYAEYEKALKEYDRRKEANVLQPGDVKKFELWLTSDSKHTYKYQSGSFTLATPSWENEPDNEKGVMGFDGQILPNQYIDNAEYHVTLYCEPIQELFKKIGMLDPNHPYNSPKSSVGTNGRGEITDYPSYWEKDIEKFLAKYEGTLSEQLNAYLLDYYNSKDGTSYTTIDDLIHNNAEASAQLTKTITSGNKWFNIGGTEFVVGAHTENVQYDVFYKQLFSFAFGDEAGLDEFLENAEFNAGTNRWEYKNNSWTDNGYKNALYYYMAHKEIWKDTDTYFQTLLDGGLSAEQATWTSLMMALNIDGVLTGNDWQDTKWPWYSSISLERMDIDFSLTKTDENGNRIGNPDPDSIAMETGFQIYYIDTITDESGKNREVKMYCTANVAEDGTVSYTFLTTPSTLFTKNGELKISEVMMKDIVYYLQEVKAPDGYKIDPDVYIVMSKSDYDQLSDKDKAALAGKFNKFLDLQKSADGLSISADFVNVQIITTTTPDPTTPPGETPPPEEPPTDPEDPDEPEEPDEPDEPTPFSEEEPENPVEEIPEDPVPLTEIPEDPVPLAEIPEEPVPLARRPITVELTDLPDEDVPLAGGPELVDLFDEDVPLADVPATGDSSMFWYVLAFLSGGCLLVLEIGSAKKRKKSLAN